MKYLFRFLVISFLVFGYSFLCVSMSDVSRKNVKAYSVNKDNLKTSNNYEELSESTLDDDILGKVNIPKIGISNNLYKLNSPLNTVEKNIEVLKSSNMPDVKGGNFILASHNGLSTIAYFHNLNKLEVGDDVYISYNGVDYRYYIDHIYDVMKTGKVEIKRDKSKSTITMITCKGEDKQLVVIGYLK